MISPKSSIHKKAKIGKNVTIGDFCVVGENVELGDGCNLINSVNIPVSYTHLTLPTKRIV